MRVSLIVTTYNWPDALSLVLSSVAHQELLPDEVVIADDGSDKNTKKIVTNFVHNFNIPVIHSWQEDSGFRAAKSRNKAIAKASGDYIILIDGDVILHPKFVLDHVKNAQVGFFIQGSRVLLSKKKTNKVLTSNQISFSFFESGIGNRKNLLHSNLFSYIFQKKKNSMKGIKTCNMSFYKNDCCKVNGFNEDFIGWGREDSEYVVRLMNVGVARKNIHFNLIQYHLFHNENTRKSLGHNDAILKDSVVSNSIYCKKGIHQYV